MSIYNALRTGVTGLAANAQRIAMISDNIANANSDGYKRVDARFSTFVTETQGAGNVFFSNGGVSARAQREIGQQGLIQGTANRTDLAVQGNGYFVVTRSLVQRGDEWRPDGTVMFTRSGGFRPDENGNLRNADGHYLLSWPTNSQGTEIQTGTALDNLRAVTVGNQVSKPIASSVLGLGANLLPQTSGSDAFRMQIEVTDRKGQSHRLDLYFEPIPSENRDLFFTDGTDNLTKTVTTTVPNGWRIYGQFDDDTAIQTFDAAGNAANLISGEGMPLADVTFDSRGRMSNLLLPGALSFYQQNALPINDGGFVVEDGSEVFSPFDLSAGNFSTPADAEQAYTEAVRILTGSGVASGTFSSPPTAGEIMDGIELLETGDYPNAMAEIMAVFARRGNDFQDVIQRAADGYPLIDEGIDQMQRHWYVGGNDVPGEPARGTPTGTKHLASRLISGASDEIAETEDNNGNDILAFYSSHARNRLQVTVDYDGRSTTNDDLVALDIDLGSMTLAGLGSGAALNRSSSNITFIGAAGNGNSGLTQFHDQISTVKFIDNNGKRTSNLANVDISTDGLVTGRFENGETRQLAQIPLVTFANPNGLAPAEGAAFIANANSGDALLRLAGSGGSGRVLASAIESAAVDIAEEFSNMIITQRGYSANAKILSTAQAMIEELSQRL